MFGSDGSPIVQYVSIFAVIFAVLAAIVLGARRLSGRGLGVSGRSGQRGRQPRLGIVDVYELDRQRQLILLRRDNVEHLLLVGGPNDVVIERNIERGQRDPALRPEAVESRPDTLPAPAFPGLAERASPDSAFAMPVVLDPAVPGPSAPPPVTHPLEMPAPEAAALGAATDETPAVETIVTGPRSEGVPRRPMRRTPPPLINPRPDVASERPRSEVPPEPVARTVREIAPAPMPPVERRTVDPAILSDMARQLEAALARPASAVTLPPRQAVPESQPRPVPAPEPALTVDPVAAAMAVPATALPERSAVEDALFEVPPATAPPAPPAPQPVPAAAPDAPPPAAEPADFKKVEAKAVEVKPPAPTPKPSANPFSVEEIEAEFARLLGRPLDKRN